MPSMSKALWNTARVVLLLCVVILSGIGILYVLDILESGTAKDLASKALLLSGVMAAGAVAVVLIGGARGGGSAKQ
jgi:asparagine N-glycosylation enzyme membrane subunit Stt3